MASLHHISIYIFVVYISNSYHPPSRSTSKRWIFGGGTIYVHTHIYIYIFYVLYLVRHRNCGMSSECRIVPPLLSGHLRGSGETSDDSHRLLPLVSTSLPGPLEWSTLKRYFCISPNPSRISEHGTHPSCFWAIPCNNGDMCYTTVCAVMLTMIALVSIMTTYICYHLLIYCYTLSS